MSEPVSSSLVCQCGRLHCFGGNSLNYSPALIDWLNGDCTGFLPTVVYNVMRDPCTA